MVLINQALKWSKLLVKFCTLEELACFLNTILGDLLTVQFRVSPFSEKLVFSLEHRILNLWMTEWLGDG